ncbi:hypothetical protein SNEBB_008509 [Seison nebaliae]|nr:hypothetical protein SNEBB_008509 [Seison nebaliae]
MESSSMNFDGYPLHYESMSAVDDEVKRRNHLIDNLMIESHLAYPISKYISNSLNKPFEEISLLLRFRTVANLIVMLLRFVQTILAYAKRYSPDFDSKTFSIVGQDVMMTEVDNVLILGNNLTFNAKFYRTDPQSVFDDHISHVLSIAPCLRNEIDNHLSYENLKKISSFNHYPEFIQRRLSKIVSLQKLNRGRIVLREGHEADSFYFISCGKVEESISNENGELIVTRILKSGDYFGEEDVLMKRRRQYTHTTLNNVELIVVKGEEYEKLFIIPSPVVRTDLCSLHTIYLLEERERSKSKRIDGFGRRVNERKKSFYSYSSNSSGFSVNSLTDYQEVPDYLKYVKNLKYFKKLPLELFIENREKFYVNYYKNDCIINYDVFSSKFIYLLRNGNGRIIKKCDNFSEETSAWKSASTTTIEDPSRLERFPFFVKLANVSSHQLINIHDICYEETDSPKYEKCIFVSEGCLCILVEKSFLAQHFDTNMRELLRADCTPLPFLYEFNTSLREIVDWKVYKEDFMKNCQLTKNLEKSKCPKKLIRISDIETMLVTNNNLSIWKQRELERKAKEKLSNEIK